MIRISIDEASAFDMLAILALKTNDANYENLLSEIIDNLGRVITNNVLGSSTYANLYSANMEVFNYIDLINSNDIDFSAKDVHLANMKRYAAKKELQKEFFGVALKEEKE